MKAHSGRVPTLDSLCAKWSSTGAIMSARLPLCEYTERARSNVPESAELHENQNKRFERI